MNEIDYKTLLSSYQQKSFDLFNQVVALESRLTISNQTIESLQKTVNSLTAELEKKSKKTTKTTEDFSNSSIQ